MHFEREYLGNDEFGANLNFLVLRESACSIFFLFLCVKDSKIKILKLTHKWEMQVVGNIIRSPQRDFHLLANNWDLTPMLTKNKLYIVLINFIEKKFQIGL